MAGQAFFGPVWETWPPCWRSWWVGKNPAKACCWDMTSHWAITNYSVHLHCCPTWWNQHETWEKNTHTHTHTWNQHETWFKKKPWKIVGLHIYNCTTVCQHNNWKMPSTELTCSWFCGSLENWCKWSFPTGLTISTFSKITWHMILQFRNEQISGRTELQTEKNEHIFSINF